MIALVLVGIVLVVAAVTVLNWMDKKDAAKVEIRPSVFDEPAHPSVDEGVDFTAGGPGKFKPKYKNPFVPYDPVSRVAGGVSGLDPATGMMKPMVAHDEAKDATGVSSGFGHDDYKAPKA